MIREIRAKGLISRQRDGLQTGVSIAPWTERFPAGPAPEGNGEPPTGGSAIFHAGDRSSRMLASPVMDWPDTYEAAVPEGTRLIRWSLP